MKIKKNKPFSVYREKQKAHHERYNSMLSDIMRLKMDKSPFPPKSCMEYINDLKHSSKSVARINTAKELRPKQYWKDKILENFGRVDPSISIRSFPSKFKIKSIHP